MIKCNTQPHQVQSWLYYQPAVSSMASPHQTWSSEWYQTCWNRRGTSQEKMYTKLPTISDWIADLFCLSVQKKIPKKGGDRYQCGYKEPQPPSPWHSSTLISVNIEIWLHVTHPTRPVKVMAIRTSWLPLPNQFTFCESSICAKEMDIFRRPVWH